MAKFNNISVTPRFNRPSTVGKTLLEFNYIKGGDYVDPGLIVSVHIFKDINNGSADNWLDLHSGGSNYGLVDPEHNDDIVAYFSDNGDEDAYQSGGSSIYKYGTGKFAVVLEEGMDWSLPGGLVYGTYTNAVTGKYWDIWTVQDNIADGNLVTYIHSFELFEDSIITLTEPLMVTTRQKLVQKYVNKNSKIDLHITSEHTVNNTNITSSIKNIFNSTILNNAAIRIIKLKDDTSSGASYEEIVPWTSDGVNVNSDDTIIYNWNTEAREIGMYELQVSSTFLDQNILSDKFNLVVR
tara:strand:+ start:7469 stop:8353 length:885 start_codon:yes stop_codon:yes gene_type:complete